MKLSEIYLKAAEIVQNDQQVFACPAIADVCFYGIVDFEARDAARKEAKDKFAEMFEPEDKGIDDGWFSKFVVSAAGRIKRPTQQQKDHRITSLLMMAAIAESEGN